MRGNGHGTARVDGAVLADGRGCRAVVNVDGDGGAHTHLSLRDGEGAGNHAGIGAARCLDFRIACEVDGATLADSRLNGVVGEYEGEASGHIRGRRTSGRLDGTGNRLGVVVGRGQEVQQVDGAEDRIGVDIDVDLVGGRVAILNRLHGDDGLVLSLGDVLVGRRRLLHGRLEVEQVRPVLADFIIAEGDDGLLGVHVQAVAQNLSVIAHECAHIGNRDIRLDMLIITGIGVTAFVADLIYRVALGMTGKAYRISHGIERGESVRKHLTNEQIELLDIIQLYDLGMLIGCPNYVERKIKLEWLKMKWLKNKCSSED